jgi:glycosyltransferase involved in cell wall biosynthesis
MPPLFSVIVPTYHRADLLAGALLTLQKQTMVDFEALVIDDGSDEDTPRLMKEWAGDARIQYHRMPQRLGVLQARNAGATRAKGTWIANLDSDDLWTFDHLAEFAAHIKGHPGVGFLFSNSYVWRWGRIVGYFFDPGRPIPEGKVPGYYAVGEEFLPYITTNLAIPRALYEKYGYHSREMRLHDNELYARMLADGVEVGVIRKPLAIRRVHEGQATHRWLEHYQESLISLNAARPSPAEFAAEKEKLVLAVAEWLWRGLEPAAARDFLVKELGDKAKGLPLYRKTFVPAPLLATAKALRRWALMLKYDPVWAPRDFAPAYDVLSAVSGMV